MLDIYVYITTSMDFETPKKHVYISRMMYVWI